MAPVVWRARHYVESAPVRALCFGTVCAGRCRGLLLSFLPVSLRSTPYVFALRVDLFRQARMTRSVWRAIFIHSTVGIMLSAPAWV